MNSYTEYNIHRQAYDQKSNPFFTSLCLARCVKKGNVLMRQHKLSQSLLIRSFPVTGRMVVIPNRPVKSCDSENPDYSNVEGKQCYVKDHHTTSVVGKVLGDLKVWKLVQDVCCETEKQKINEESHFAEPGTIVEPVVVTGWEWRRWWSDRALDEGWSDVVCFEGL